MLKDYDSMCPMFGYGFCFNWEETEKLLNYYRKIRPEHICSELSNKDFILEYGMLFYTGSIFIYCDCSDECFEKCDFFWIVKPKINYYKNALPSIDMQEPLDVLPVNFYMIFNREFKSEHGEIFDKIRERFKKNSEYQLFCIGVKNNS